MPPVALAGYVISLHFDSPRPHWAGTRRRTLPPPASAGSPARTDSLAGWAAFLNSSSLKKRT